MKKFLLATAALLLSTSSFAQVYVGGVLGWTNQDVNCGDWSGCDKSDTGFKLYGGYKFTPIISAEVSYTDFGKVSLSAPGFSGSYTGTAFGMGAAFTMPLAPKLSGTARVGLASTDADYKWSTVIASDSSSEGGIEPYFGLALGYALTPQLSLTGSFDYQKFDYPRGSGGATLFGVGLSFAF